MLKKLIKWLDRHIGYLCGEKPEGWTNEMEREYQKFCNNPNDYHPNRKKEEIE